MMAEVSGGITRQELLREVQRQPKLLARMAYAAFENIEFEDGTISSSSADLATKFKAGEFLGKQYGLAIQSGLENDSGWPEDSPLTWSQVQQLFERVSATERGDRG